jgi:hypothetical protein
MGLTFQVADAKKPLIAVKRITEKGTMSILDQQRMITSSRTRRQGTRCI